MCINTVYLVYSEPEPCQELQFGGLNWFHHSFKEERHHQAAVAASRSGKGAMAISDPSFYREKDYPQMEKIQDNCQSFQEWTSHQVHFKVRPFSAQSNKSNSYISTLQASVCILKFMRLQLEKNTEQIKTLLSKKVMAARLMAAKGCI